MAPMQPANGSCGTLPTVSGSTWTKSGSTITSASSLTSQSFTINQSGSTRIEIRKTSGTTNRINFDNLSITSYGSGGGGTTDTTVVVTTGKKFLFDASHYENAGSADWLIDADDTESIPTYTGSNTTELKAQRTPTPAASGITSSTAETYWKGAISAWGVSLVKLGNSVESLPSDGSITYGDASNAQDLSKYDVFVICEPNKLFTTSEKKAIMNFVNAGGGLFMIADHTSSDVTGTDANGYNPSDRDGDGYDSPRVLNDLMKNNGINNDYPFGFEIDLVDFSEKPTTKVYTGSNANATAVLKGTQGTASKLAFYGGTSATLYLTKNTTTQGLFWRESGTVGNNANVMALIATYGQGRVMFVGDSSPADDGTGDTNDNLFNGWSGDKPSDYTSHPALHLNGSLWLAKVTN